MSSTTNMMILGRVADVFEGWADDDKLSNRAGITRIMQIKRSIDDVFEWNVTNFTGMCHGH